MWNRTILCLFQNSSLRKDLLQWAETKQLCLLWADPDSPDLIGIGYFALILDRTMITKKRYVQFLEFLKEVQNNTIAMGDEMNGIRDESICILLDPLKDLEFPLLDIVLQVNVRQPNAVPWIINNLEIASPLAVG